MFKLVCWNIAKNHDPWRCLIKNEMNAHIALLQEATKPPENVADCLNVDASQFKEIKSQCTIIKLTYDEDVNVKRLTPEPLSFANDSDFKTTHPGCIAAAIISAPGVEPFYVVSMCPEYEKPYRCAGKSWNIVDASVHRVISDLSLLIGKQRGHRVIVAGDFSVYYGYGEDKSGYWKGRYDTVFDRMKALGLCFVGPQHPCGRKACPPPQELPGDSKNVPTYCKAFKKDPESAVHQLDYVFASESMANSVKVRALNRPEEWGPSDHCRIEIEVE